jgi:hypothetical protein
VPKEAIIGIPEKGKIHPVRTSKDEDWEFVIHDHDAKQAGRHFDVRLGDPKTGHAHSWAMRYLPKPGEKRLAVAQSTHTIPYMDWSGTIEHGYGAGDVAIHKRGQVKVLSSSPMKISFQTAQGEVYSMVKTKSQDGKAWLMVNRSGK